MSFQNMLGISAPEPAVDPTATKIDSPPVQVDTTDVDSNATEISKATSDGEVVDSPPENGAMAAPTAPGEFKLALPEPLEKASQLALVAVKDWWAQLEPLLQKLQLQMLEQLDPYLKASAAGFERLQAELAPHTAPALKVLAEWQEKLEPHAKQALAAVQEATEAMRVKAYEPALAAIATASTAVQAHAQTTAALVSAKAVVGFEASKEWLEAQRPVLQKAHETAMAHAAALLAALLEWKKQMEPLVLAQLQLAQEKALTMGVQAQAQLQDFSKTAPAQLGEQLEKAKVAAAPHVAKVQAWTEERVGEAKVVLEPHLRPAIAWTEEQGKKMEPVVKPAAEAIKAAGLSAGKHIAEWAKQLQPHLAQFQVWLEAQLQQSMQCLCLPIQQQLNFKAANEEYPPPVMPAEAKVVD